LAPLIGSLWFCLRRDVCEYLVRQETSPLTSYLMGLKVCDEILFPTLLGNNDFDIVPSNHLVNEFVGSHPRPFDGKDLEALARSSRFFARKFRNDPEDEARVRVLKRMERRSQDQRAPARAVPGADPRRPFPQRLDSGPRPS